VLQGASRLEKSFDFSAPHFFFLKSRSRSKCFAAKQSSRCECAPCQSARDRHTVPQHAQRQTGRSTRGQLCGFRIVSGSSRNIEHGEAQQSSPRCHGLCSTSTDAEDPEFATSRPRRTATCVAARTPSAPLVLCGLALQPPAQRPRHADDTPAFKCSSS
jgi:hypothetical protein